MCSPLYQGFPPIPDSANIDIARLLLNMGLAIAWTIVAGVSFAVAISIGMRVFNALSPGLDKLEELKKGNMAVAVVFATYIICLTAVVVAILLK